MKDNDSLRVVMSTRTGLEEFGRWLDFLEGWRTDPHIAQLGARIALPPTEQFEAAEIGFGDEREPILGTPYLLLQFTRIEPGPRPFVWASLQHPYGVALRVPCPDKPNCVRPLYVYDHELLPEEWREPIRTAFQDFERMWPGVWIFASSPDREPVQVWPEPEEAP